MKRIALILTLAAIFAVVTVATAPGIVVAQDDPAKEEKKEAEAAEKIAKEEKEEAAKTGDPKEKEEAKKAEEVAKEEKKEAEKKEKEEKKKKEMPKTGGIDLSGAAFVGLATTALLIGGGLLVRRARR